MSFWGCWIQFRAEIHWGGLGSGSTRVAWGVNYKSQGKHAQTPPPPGNDFLVIFVTFKTLFPFDTSHGYTSVCILCSSMQFSFRDITRPLNVDIFPGIFLNTIHGGILRRNVVVEVTKIRQKWLLTAFCGCWIRTWCQNSMEGEGR